MTEESICQGCEADGFCQIQDDKNEFQYNCQINSKWASAQGRLKAVKNWFSEYGYNPSSFKCWKELEKILSLLEE